MNRIALAALTAVFLSTSAMAAYHQPNKPCTGKKRGISHCDGKRFVCRDASVSQSKKDCRVWAAQFN